MKETRLEKWIRLAHVGTKENVEEIMGNLSMSTTFQETREIDHALSHIKTDEGMNCIKHYLFNGTQIQRNYAALFFGRIHEYILLREAYEMGLIDEIQAFSR